MTLSLYEQVIVDFYLTDLRQRPAEAKTSFYYISPMRDSSTVFFPDFISDVLLPLTGEAPSLEQRVSELEGTLRGVLQEKQMLETEFAQKRAKFKEIFLQREGKHRTFIC